MEDQKIYNLVIKKSNRIAHIIYWLIAACIMMFVFSNRNYDYNIRLILVSSIILFSYIVTQIINNYLIPSYLFRGKFWIFIYLMLGIFVTILWAVLYSSILIVVYSAYKLPHIIVPQKDDIIILVSGNYLIIILAAVIHFIKESYSKLIEKDRIKKLKQIADVKLKETHQKLLQGQIHPHFLFNMLNNLYGLVKEDVNSSREVIIKLSNLLDYMLYKCDKSNVYLEDEIRFLYDYIELERIRHDENFNVVTAFPKNGQEIELAPLVLFPFVENAFKHGFHDTENSFINITLSLEGNLLKFVVENSVHPDINDKYLSQEGKGIGLTNIKERLELIYKNKYQLDIIHNETNFRINLEIDLS